MESDAETGGPPLAIRVLRELMAVRKTSEGWTTATAGLYPTICAILGGGDPSVTYSALRVAVLSLIDSPGVKAAAASLGLTTDLPTHTDRLNDAGTDLRLGERQVRRLSDLGLKSIAQFIATNWNQTAVPILSVSLIRTSDLTADLAVGTRRLLEVEMRQPILTVDGSPLACILTTQKVAGEMRQYSIHQLTFQDDVIDLGVQWLGELWPRFFATVSGDWREISISTLGNRFSLTARANAGRVV